MQSFMIGFTAGVGLGMLFAPRSGSATRGYVTSKAAEGAGYIRRQTDEVRESALDVMDRSKEAMLRQVERLTAMQASGSEVYQR
jgi:gas vesicle protein